MLSLIYKVPHQGSAPETLRDWIIRDEQKEYELVKRENVVRSREVDPQLRSKEKWEISREEYKILVECKKLETERHKHQLNLPGRYFIAWALASTLYNIHASGWFNQDGLSEDGSTPDDSGKNKEDDTKPEGQTKEETDYHADFDDELEPAKAQGFDLEHELCNHPERYKGGTATYENKHDIYSLGVSLREIGNWFTIFMEMSTAIATARQSSSPPSPVHIKLLQEQIRLRSKDPRLVNKMGPVYGEIVRRCLIGSFECLDEDWKGDDGGDAAC
ncbi:hypothetical protein B0J13DRAFT_531596 [Dactylonectria estremocensis]|uniref:Protein kinase domain-containing protein n=1 Tax=Dactylonectria estremocensis TaxID=1079267 RepID=A0A9P9DQM0_9HYPO|nr:hypothetical protein B0J13DRAFT_531596 [Dactylonectria estremocensis]